MIVNNSAFLLVHSTRFDRVTMRTNASIKNNFREWNRNCSDASGIALLNLESFNEIFPEASQKFEVEAFEPREPRVDLQEIFEF